MRINYYHNYSVLKYLGGAELTDLYWMAILKTKHDVKEVTLDEEMPEADLTIIGNCGAIDKPKNKYICIIHGYKHPRLDYLYEGAEQIIYTSPIRQKEDGLPRSTCIAPFIDANIFMDKKSKRAGNLYIGRIHKNKGFDNLKKWARKNKETIDLYGQVTEDTWKQMSRSKYLNYKGQVSQADVADLMNSYKRFIFLPEEKESFGRTIVEAHLCGIEVVTIPEKIGAYSWGWDFNNREEITNKLNEQLIAFGDNINALTK